MTNRNSQAGAAATSSKAASEDVSYLDLPNKPQLLLLCLVRLIDPMASTSINAYLYFQLQYLLPGASAPEIATHVGYLVAAGTAAKVCTNVWWGRLADSSYGGRKMVLLIGLSSGCVAATCYGMSTTFTGALLSQVFAGAMSSNVGMVRCIVAELNPEKKLRSRALLLIAACANVGQFIGPLVGGFLSSTPGEGPVKTHPYLLPNLVVATCFATAALGVAFFLEETLEQPKGNRRPLDALWNKVKDKFTQSLSQSHAYAAIPAEGSTELLSTEESDMRNDAEQVQEKISFREIWTPQVVCTLVAQFIISGHVTSFAMLWVVFLSTPINKTQQSHTSITHFSGGVGLNSASIGVVMAMLNGVSIVLSLVVYPMLNDSWGTVRLWRGALLIFPFTYLFAPSPALIASSMSGITGRTPTAVWLAIAGVLILNVLGRAGALPAMTILINDCVPGPSARATVNSAGTSSAQLSKTIFPFIMLAVYAWGLKNDIVGLPFWILSGLALIAIVASRWVKSVDAPTSKEIRPSAEGARV